MRVSHDRRLFRPDSVLIENFKRALRLGLLCGKTVPAIDLRKVSTEPQRLDNCPRWIHRFVREHGQFPWSAVARTLNRSQGILDAVVDRGVVEFVLAVIRKEELET